MARPTIQQAMQTAVQHHRCGQLPQAEALYRQVLAQQPNHPDALHLLGLIANQMGRNDVAIELIGRAVALKPNYPEAHNNLGNALKELGRIDEAIAAYHQAITLQPGLAEVYNNLGLALTGKGQLDEAVAAVRRAIALKPDYPEAHNNLGDALKDQLQLDDAIDAYRRAIALRPGYFDGHSSLLRALHFHPGYDAQSIAEEHRRWNQQHAEPLKQYIRPHANDRNPERRLRIGYVSPDFRAHPVGRFLLPILAHHDKDQFEIFAYAQVLRPDQMTEQMRSHTNGWRSIVGLPDAQAADLIRHDRIDILIDLAGHTAGNRLLLFARKPAPVQVTYLGYPDTTGLSAIDYRLTDAYADPPGQTEQYHSEQLVRLSPCAWCYWPLHSPPAPPRPDRSITFGCFNNFAKVTEPMLRLWARVLQAVPDSRLMLKSAGLGSETVRQRVRSILDSEGVASDRLELRGPEPDYADHLALYSSIDIALDTFPYHGTTTTCEALWMGAPVVSVAGQTHVSRVGVSLLSNAGLPELVAQSEDDYVRIAADLARDPARLRTLRSTLRQQMQQSPLMDAPRFARSIELAYRQMWRRWCAEPSSSR